MASAIWKLMGEGKLDVLRPVCDYFPEFAGEGKEAIRVEQLLYHEIGHNVDSYQRRWTEANLSSVEEFADQYAYQRTTKRTLTFRSPE